MEKTNYAIPVAIVIAGLLIAGAVLYGDSDRSLFKPQGETSGSALVTDLSPISATDNLIGPADATLTLVEYSDLECPFCKVFHQAMTTIKDKHSIAWVYRHYPIDSLHSQAREEAEAAACVGKLGGDAKFWQYVDKIFATTTSNDGLDLTLLPKFATEVGINQTDYETCITNGEGKTIVEADEATGNQIGVSGTPYPVLIDTNGKAYAIFEQSFNLETAKVSSEAKAFIQDLYTEYERIVRQ